MITRQARYIVAVAARRSGKTVGSRALILAACNDKSDGNVGYVAPTLGQARRLLWRPLMRDLRDPVASQFLESKPNQAEMTVEFKSGTRLYIFSAEAYERIRGDGFKLIVTDETDDPLFTDDVFDEAIGPALSDNQGRLVQLGTPKGRGRLYKEYRKGQPGEHYDPEYESIQVSAMEAGIIAPEEVERARKTRPARAFAQEYLATFNSPVGIVYEEWNPARHVVSASQLPAKFDYAIVGVDWGTASRGSMMVIAVDRSWSAEHGDRPRLWVIDEYSVAGMPYTDDGWWKIARDIQAQWHPIAWYCDPSGGLDKYLAQLSQAVKSVGSPTVVQPADNKVRPGISMVQEFLHYDDVLKEEPHLFILDNCQQIQGEFGGYRYRSHRNLEGEFVDEVVKQNDHCLDALRYGVMTRFGRGSRKVTATGSGWTSP